MSQFSICVVLLLLSTTQLSTAQFFVNVGFGNQDRQCANVAARSLTAASLGCVATSSNTIFEKRECNSTHFSVFGCTDGFCNVCSDSPLSTVALSPCIQSGDTYYKRMCVSSALRIEDFIPQLTNDRKVIVEVRKVSSGGPDCSNYSSQLFELSAAFAGCVDIGDSNTLTTTCNSTHRIDIQCVQDTSLSCSNDCVETYAEALSSCAVTDGQVRRSQICVSIPGSAPLGTPVTQSSSPTNVQGSPNVFGVPVAQPNAAAPKASAPTPEVKSAPAAPKGSNSSTAETITISIIMFLFVAFAVL